jgi:hypothetical protein
MNILDEANEIIYGDREQTYGEPGKNLERISRLWSMYISTKYDADFQFSAEDVCWMMTLLKMARQMNATKRDNLVDAAGYIALIERIP